jgi:isopenicillin-N N-acyltransferase-like protein
MTTSSAVQPFPLIHVGGPPRERGFSYGRQAGERIAIGAALYRSAFEAAGVDWSTACSRAKYFLERIGHYDRDMFDEILGIARGSEQPVEVIVAINARTEILFGQHDNEDAGRTVAATMQEECTAALALPPITQNGHVLHGQNWDWNPGCEATTVVLRIDNHKGPNVLTLVEAGQLARHGFNSAGIALTVNGLHCDHDTGKVGVPSPLMRRRLLTATTLGQALETVLATKISFSHNLLVSHSDGVAVDIEATPEQNFWIQPEESLMVHANHFKCPVARARVRDVGLQQCPESLYRDQRVYEHLHNRRGAITMKTLQEAFADRFGEPDAVLRSPKPRSNGTVSATVASLIMDTTQRTMWVAPSPYKGTHYTQYDLAF